jgi:hypothetical protein
MTRRFWESTGGTLIEEFPVVAASLGVGARRLDGLILPGGEFCRASASEVDIVGHDVIVVQTKASPLGMYLMGQALFSAELIRDWGPKSVRTVALCTRSDARLALLCERYGIEVEVDDPSA